MAKRGRKPRPTEVKRVLGNPGKRALPEAEPEFAAGDIPAPEWLDELEREEWDRIVPALVRVKVGKPVHQGALEGICTMYGAWRKARIDMDWTQARLTYDAYRKALNEFGLTAASAGRVNAKDDGGEADPMDKYFGPRLAG